MKRYKLTIAYDGTAYCGWQRQPDPTPTVQREVEKAAAYVVSHTVTVNGSSRTDTGVHAMGQVAAMNVESDLDPQTLRRAINSRLPHDILIRTLEEVPPDFDVRTAVRKRYRYLIWADKDRPVFYRHYVYHFYRDLDLARMKEACAAFIGTHDFEAFKGQSDERENTVRTIFNCTIRRARDIGASQLHARPDSADPPPQLPIANCQLPTSPLVIFAVEGSGFLYHMVRTMVGTLLNVGTGHWQASRVAEIIAGKDRKHAGPCVPAVGLHLQWIRF